MDKRETWFSEGAPLFRRALEQIGLADRLPSEGDYYACPCCLIALPYAAIAAQELTIEHVPPSGLGGKGILLTCKPCNNNSGTHFDSHAITRAAIHDLLMGEGSSRPIRATFTADGVDIRGEVLRAGNGWLLQGVPKRNNPVMVDAHEEALRRASESDAAASLSFTLSERFSSTRADVSWVRSAYLAAFTALGWRYILRPELDPVRALLRDPENPSRPPFIGFNPKSNVGRREIMLVESPGDLSGVCVIIDQFAVFLPDPWGTSTCESLADVLSQYRGEGGKVMPSLSGKVVPWPAKPMYLLDKAIA
ncbi:HNH endonuclease [Streptomyces sp. NPDC001514]